MTSLALLTGVMALAACGPDGCSSARCVATTDYEWRTSSAEPGRSYLFRHGVQVGGYDHEHGIYRVYHADTDTWDAPQPPPWEETERTPISGLNFGVDTDKLNGHDEAYHLNGTPVSEAQARKALADGGIPDDAARLRLTVIGPANLTTRVVDDLARSPALAEWKNRLVPQCYLPEHWSVGRAGFVTSGKPTIYVQAPDGKVLHRQDDYDDGPEGLARALRRADPNYDARKDPDLRKLRPHFDWSLVPTPLWFLAAGAVWLFLRRS